MGYSPLLHKINKLIKEGKTNEQISTEVYFHTMTGAEFNYLIEVQRKRVENEGKAD